MVFSPLGKGLGNRSSSPKRKAEVPVLFDILIALLITAVAVILGITVHPLLFLLVVLAIIWLFTRHAGGRRRVV